MDSPQKLLKIKIERPTYSLHEWERDLIRWEDEGGLATVEKQVSDKLEAPVNIGDVIKIVDGQIICENGELFIAAKVSILSHR